MRKRIFRLSVIFVSVFLSIGTLAFSDSPKKNEEKKSAAETCQSDGVYGGISAGNFNIKPVKMIKMKIHILEIKATETNSLMKPVVITKDGGEVSIRFGSKIPTHPNGVSKTRYLNPINASFIRK